MPFLRKPKSKQLPNENTLIIASDLETKNTKEENETKIEDSFDTNLKNKQEVLRRLKLVKSYKSKV